MQTLVRLAILGALAVATLASASSSSQPTAAIGPPGTSAAPPSQPMDPAVALGLWKSSFGPVKIEFDRASGERHVMGVWVYDRQGREIVGFFSGELDGNVLRFAWQEPGDLEPLEGEGYLVFNPAGASFAGRWWTDRRDRSGDWSGWRAGQVAQPASDHQGQDGYPADGYPADDYQGDGDYPVDEYPREGYPADDYPADDGYGQPPAGQAPPPPPR